MIGKNSNNGNATESLGSPTGEKEIHNSGLPDPHRDRRRVAVLDRAEELSRIGMMHRSQYRKGDMLALTASDV